MRSLFRSLLALILWAGLAPSASAASALHGPLRQLQQQQRWAGIVAATVQAGRTETLALGVSHSGTRQPLRADARVQIGSIAKTLMALAVLRLVSEGRLSLDAPLHTLLPQVALHNPWGQGSPVRLRHLLDMTSGLPDLQLWHLFNRAHTAQQPLALALRPEAGPWVLRSEPGTRFLYSNLGYTLVGMVVEAATGERYEAWAARELLQPLGLHDSHFEHRTPADDPRLAWGHADDAGPVISEPTAVRPAALFTTTAADMARLMQFLLGDGSLAGRHFVSPGLMAAVGRPGTTLAAQAGLQTGYGLGLFTRDRHGAVGLCHGGNVAGWRAMFCVFRDTGRGFFWALNHDREDAPQTPLDALFVQHLGLAPPALPFTTHPAPAPLARAEDAPWSGLYVPAPGRLPALALVDRLAGFWWLRLGDGAATLREGFGATRRLLPAGAGLYRQADRQQATLALLRGAQGEPLVGSGHLTLRRVSVLEQGLLGASVAAGMLALGAALPRAAWQLGRRSSAAPRRWTGALALPASAAALGPLLLGAALLAWWQQGWQQLGAFTPAAVAVAAASLVWPLACAAQGLLAWRRQRRGKSWRTDAVLALAGLQFAAVLAAFHWMPLLPWRL